MSGGREDVQCNSEAGCFFTGKTFTGGECQLEEVARRKPKERIAADSIGIGVCPGNRVAFEADNCHVWGDASGDPTLELWRFWGDGGSRRKVQVAGSRKRGLISVDRRILICSARSRGAQSR